MRRTARELWEISKLWWLVVPGGALGVVAIAQAINGTHGKSVWFWGFWAMTALAFALAWRLRRVVQERDQVERALGDDRSAEAGARRLDDLADEALIIRDDEVPSGDSWGDMRIRCAQVFRHWQERVDAEVRRSANAYMDIWRVNPENPMLLHFSSPQRAREMIDFCVAQVREISAELRKQ